MEEGYRLLLPPQERQSDGELHVDAVFLMTSADIY
jgi:hypothetical protein